MKGIHQVIVESKRIRYQFSLRRNLTIIRGDSATGKTTLIDMIRQCVNNPSRSAISVRCDKDCYVLSGVLWENTVAVIRLRRRLGKIPSEFYNSTCQQDTGNQNAGANKKQAGQEGHPHDFPFFA